MASKSIRRWCLGFMFSWDFDNVILLKKGKSLHAGLWNGVGGAVELGESVREAMSRECQEESGLTVYPNDWAKVGSLMSSGYWQVDIFTYRFPTGFFELSKLPIYKFDDSMIEPPVEADKPGLVPMAVIHRLSAAPHTGPMIFASLAMARYPNQQPFVTLSVVH